MSVLLLFYFCSFLSPSVYICFMYCTSLPVFVRSSLCVRSSTSVCLFVSLSFCSCITVCLSDYIQSLCLFVKLMQNLSQGKIHFCRTETDANISTFTLKFIDTEIITVIGSCNVNLNIRSVGHFVFKFGRDYYLKHVGVGPWINKRNLVQFHAALR